MMSFERIDEGREFELHLVTHEKEDAHLSVACSNSSDTDRIILIQYLYCFRQEAQVFIRTMRSPSFAQKGEILSVEDDRQRLPGFLTGARPLHDYMDVQGIGVGVLNRIPVQGLLKEIFNVMDDGTCPLLPIGHWLIMSGREQETMVIDEPGHP